MARLILAVDPGETSGWCLMYDDQKVDCSGHLRIDSTVGAKKLAVIVLSAAHDGGCLDMVIEDQHPGGYMDGKGQYQRASFATTLALGRRRGQWEQSALENGMKLHAVKATVWQNALLKCGGRPDRATLKTLSQARAARAAGVRHIEYDEADAICLALYWVTANPPI